ncbi:MAG: hypothetical protein ACREA9_03550 [Pyrinomonadaceae bacterium]
MECNSASCIGAKADVQSRRGTFARACNAFKVFDAITRFIKNFTATQILYLVAALALIAAVAYALGLFPLAGLAAALAIIVLVVYATAWIATLVFANYTAQLAVDLAFEQSGLLQAIQRVLQFCPPECRGDVSMPNC